MTVRALLTNTANGKTTFLHLKPPAMHGGCWHCNIRAQRNAYARIGAVDTWRGNTVKTNTTYRAVDKNGYCVSYELAS